MRMFLLPFLFYLFGCSHAPVERKIASEKPKSPRIDYNKSSVQLFPSAEGHDDLTYYFYLQIKNTSDEFIDINSNVLSLKANKGKKLKYKFEKILEGRYYLSFRNSEHLDISKIHFYLKDKPLREEFKLRSQKPDAENTKISVIEHLEHRSIFQLRLADKFNQPVDVGDPPEIVFEGWGEIEDIRFVKDGIWEFTVVYPEYNQIMYFSVRAQGVYFPRLYRFQYVEK